MNGCREAEASASGLRSFFFFDGAEERFQRVRLRARVQTAPLNLAQSAKTQETITSVRYSLLVVATNRTNRTYGARRRRWSVCGANRTGAGVGFEEVGQSNLQLQRIIQ